MTTAPVPPKQGGRLAALSFGQVISWGILYYALIVASPAVAESTGWPLTLVTLSFSVGLIASALAGLFVGRWLDAQGPRVIMTIGSVVGPIGLTIVAFAPNLTVFTLGWVLVGLAQSTVLYQAAFTVITRRYDGERRRGAMTILTLAGGLASTIFAPIVAGLLNVTDWRTVFLLLAGFLLISTAPLNWFTLERAWQPIPHDPSAPAHTVRSVLRTRRYWMLEISLVALATAMFSVSLSLIPLFTEKGMTYELAALALGLLGAGQVIGRLLYMVIPHTAAPWVPLVTTTGLSAFSIALLALVPGPPWLLISIGILAGAVRGAQTLVQGSAAADRWGTRNYGAINGISAAPLTIVTAFGPSLGPLLAVATGSYSSMALMAVGLALVALIFARFS